MRKNRMVALVLLALLAASLCGVTAVAAADAGGDSYLLLDDCDRAWPGTTADSADYKQGAGCVRMESGGESNNVEVMLSQTFFSPQKTTLTKADAEFCFWLYLDKVSAVTEYAGDKYFAVELSSDSNCDVAEFEFNLMPYAENGTIRSGEWTYLRIPVSAGSLIGAPDMNGLKRIRFLSRGDGRVMRVDEISLRKTGYDGEILSPIQYKNVLTDPALFAGAAVDAETFIEKSSARLSGKNIAFTASEAFGFTNLRENSFGVSLFLYVTDAANVSEVKLTVSDESGKTLRYSLNQTLENGWNFLVFDKDNRVAADSQPSAIDYEKLKGFSLEVAGRAELTANLERVRVINTESAFNYSPYGFEEESGTRVFGMDTSKRDARVTTILAIEIACTAVLAALTGFGIVLLLKKSRGKKAE